MQGAGIMHTCNMAGFRVRAAEPGDCEEIIRMIQELAEFEKLPDQVKNTAEGLCRDGFEESSPLFRCLVMESEDDEKRAAGGGLGSKLFAAVAESCLALGCARLQLSVLDWNHPAISFYRSRGARDLSAEEGWRLYRFLPEDLRRITGSADPSV
ncbi:thialysine N-epsilon-acetyltransferase-like isoform X2 [Dendropsophus ebraccatus]|uniref:thialysine N-epsilon-acetyltransferase-like isoform X2 n=1 Tax=Dendropsophus ebraccatus TaxID=150705 RepID=UPI0038313202